MPAGSIIKRVLINFLSVSLRSSNEKLVLSDTLGFHNFHLRFIGPKSFWDSLYTPNITKRLAATSISPDRFYCERIYLFFAKIQHNRSLLFWNVNDSHVAVSVAHINAFKWAVSMFRTRRRVINTWNATDESDSLVSKYLVLTCGSWE